MTTFHICHCGNINYPHNFRHSFEGLIEVSRVKDEFGDVYSFDSDKYPVVIKKKCSKDDCNYSKPIHGSSVLPHEYVETEVKYREIKFTVPPDTQCRICKILLKEHHKVETHHFKTKVIFRKEKDDIIKIVHRDNDRKIIWE